MKPETSTAFAQRLGMDLPLIQGPFGGGLSTVELTATVSNNGGLGSYGAHNLEGDGVAQIVASIKSQTDRAFAVNLWVGDHDQGGDDMSLETFQRAWQFYEPYFREFGLEQPEPPLHYHPLQFEDFKVLEGELTIKLNNTMIAAAIQTNMAICVFFIYST